MAAVVPSYEGFRYPAEIISAVDTAGRDTRPDLVFPGNRDSPES
jgi:hypothetical protein